MADRGRGAGQGPGGGSDQGPGGGSDHGTGGQTYDQNARAQAVSELESLRREIDALDVRIVGLLNARAELGLAIGQAKLTAGWSGVRDPKREREVLLRVTMANPGPLPQADLLAIYRRLIAATRSIEEDDRRTAGPHGGRPRGEE